MRAAAPPPQSVVPLCDISVWAWAVRVADDWERLLQNNFTPRLEVKLHEKWIEKISFCKEAGGLLSCASDGTLQLHTLTVHGDLKLRHKLHSPTGKPIMCFAYSAPHASVATCGIERQIHWWSLSISEPIATLYGHAAAVVSIVMDDANHQLISLDSESNVRVWDVRRFITVQVIPPLERSPVSILMHDPRMHTLLLAHNSLAAHPSIFAHLRKAGGSESAAAPSADDSGPASPPGRRERSLLGAIASSTLSLVLAVDEGATVRSWQCADGTNCFRFQLEKAPMTSAASAETAAGEGASAVAFDHSGRRLLVGRQDGRVRVYNFSSGQCLAECMPPAGRASGQGAHACEITSVMGVRDGNLSYIVACGWSREVWVWPDQREGLGFQIECSCVMRGHREDVTCLGYCAPNLLASGGYDGVILMWNLASGTARGGRLIHEPYKEDHGVLGRGAIRDGSPAVVGGEVARGSGVDAARGRGGGGMGARAFARSDVVCVEQLTFINLVGETPSPILVSAGSDARLRFWSVVSSSLLFVLPLSPPPGAYSSTAFPITALHWSAEAATLIIGDSTGRVGLWDCAALRPALKAGAGGAIVDATARRMYNFLRPRVRWHAHEAPVVGAQVVCADWSSFSARRPAEQSAAEPSDESMTDILESALGGDGTSPPARGAAAVAAADSEDGEDEYPGGALLMTAGRDGTMRMWTVRGRHVGAFSRDSWRAGESTSYGPTPQCAITEPPRTWEHPSADAPPKGTSPPKRRGMLVKTEGSAFLTAMVTDEEREQTPAVASAMEKLLRVRERRQVRLQQEGEAALIARRRDNDESSREALLAQHAQLGMHSALTAAQSISSGGPLEFGLRPSSAALRHAVSAPVLPPLREAPSVDYATQSKRANERARALLKGKVRDHQEKIGGGLGSDATRSTDQFFSLREERRANRAQPRDQQKTYDLGHVYRLKKVDRGGSRLPMFGR